MLKKLNKNEGNHALKSVILFDCDKYLKTPENTSENFRFSDFGWNFFQEILKKTKQILKNN